MNSTLSLVISIDPTLHHYTPETLPDAGWDRVRALHRSGSLDRHLTDDQDLELRGMVWDMCCDPILVFSGPHPDDTVYRIFSDGSIHVITNADSEVWSSASEFVRERLLCDCDREELTGTDARLADYAFSAVYTVTY